MTAGSGVISIRFLNYYNQAGEDSSGACCDPLCDTCDHFFIICMDHADGTTSTSNCPYGTKTTGAIEQNNIDFTSSIDGTPNPMQFNFNSWPVSHIVVTVINTVIF